MHDTSQLEFHDQEQARHNLDILFEESRLYHSSRDYKDLLDFVARMPNMAPFNAMLLRLQKPGISFVATLKDWKERFSAELKEDARPLIILRNFGPISLVYDVMDVVSPYIPQDAHNFQAKWKHKPLSMGTIMDGLHKNKAFTVKLFDKGDNHAGLIRCVVKPKDKKTAGRYEIKINRNHEAAVQFVTLAHELAHLYLGHLYEDKKLGIPHHRELDCQTKELEAESVAYLVCERNGVESRSKTYLANFVDNQKTIESLDIYQIMRVANQVETLIGLDPQPDFGTSFKLNFES